ncbi:hypothetical protein J7E88_03600 [Streptomyces sp. ISL-10]|uniref:hypothetical protein n=1 Tax=Streptomyces sp. ISL-10 TaxID=2819172 RepID=UPI001BE5C7D7|nr:hypothetical protein [Streptomyces sp. ISL-10]MBT2364432.1 hypothetical protein [Streptomyces sp. ISL-10]
MNGQETKERTPRVVRVALATAGSSAVLLALHALGGFFVLNALLTESEGPWDRTLTETVRLMAVLGLWAEVVAAAVTAGFVALRCVRRWWYAIPLVLILTAMVRMVFAPGP